MNDEPCMCGTGFTCLADVHVMPTTQAAGYLGISARGVRLAVDRERLRAVGRDADGWLFDRADLDSYAATRRRRPVAERDREPVPSSTSG